MEIIETGMKKPSEPRRKRGKRRAIGSRRDFYRHRKLYYTLPSRRLGNIIWLTLGGWVVPLYFLFVGWIYLLTIIGAKKAWLCFRFAQFSLLPFGTEVRLGFDRKKFGNLFWFFTTGWPISFACLVISWAFRATIIGTPVGEQYRKLSKLTLCPFGAKFGFEKPTLELRPFQWSSQI